MNAYLVTIIIKHHSHNYEEFFTIRCSNQAEAEKLAWDYLKNGYYWDTDSDDKITADENKRTIEEPYGDRLFTIDSVNEIPPEYIKILQSCRVAFDATDQARRHSCPS